MKLLWKIILYCKNECDDTKFSLDSGMFWDGWCTNILSHVKSPPRSHSTLEMSRKPSQDMKQKLLSAQKSDRKVEKNQTLEGFYQKKKFEWSKKCELVDGKPIWQIPTLAYSTETLSPSSGCSHTNTMGINQAVTEGPWAGRGIKTQFHWSTHWRHVFMLLFDSHGPQTAMTCPKRHAAF